MAGLKPGEDDRERVRGALNDYLARTGLSYRDFARRINYSP